MKARPIIFSAPMVRALLDGRKTQTRRIIRPAPPAGAILQGHVVGSSDKSRIGKVMWMNGAVSHVARLPYGKIGDLLWVRESLKIFNTIHRETGEYGLAAYYAAGGGDMQTWVWNGRTDASGIPSIHMPRSASRLTLKITDIRVERLQDISEEDAIAEGVEKAFFQGFKIYHKWALPNESYPSAKDSFQSLWESIHGKESWQENPWVWVISFEVIHANVDKILAGEGE